MLMKKENGQLILSESILSQYGDVEYFHVVVVPGGIDITPAPGEPKERKGIASLRGKGKGKVWMADDFNDTPEEFAEYM